MFGSPARGASAYAKVGVETGVVAASPHQLIVMLFDGALISLSHAQQHMRMANIVEKGRAISKAIDIIDNGLRASLNRDAGGDIAAGLDALYVYMSSRLLEANLNNDASKLEEVQRLLTEMKGAWEAIRPGSDSNVLALQMAAPPRVNTDGLAPLSSALAKA